MKKLATCLAVLTTLSISSMALAGEEGAAPPPAATQEKAQRGAITLPPIEITSHYMRPQASFTVSRINAQLTLVELKQLFLQRIEQSVLKGAF